MWVRGNFSPFRHFRRIFASNRATILFLRYLGPISRFIIIALAWKARPNAPNAMPTDIRRRDIFTLSILDALTVRKSITRNCMDIPIIDDCREKEKLGSEAEEKMRQFPNTVISIFDFFLIKI